jgi:hypothetical protein
MFLKLFSLCPKFFTHLIYKGYPNKTITANATEICTAYYYLRYKIKKISIPKIYYSNFNIQAL